LEDEIKVHVRRASLSSTPKTNTAGSAQTFTSSTPSELTTNPFADGFDDDDDAYEALLVDLVPVKRVTADKSKV
jgi:hypothetical protein